MFYTQVLGVECVRAPDLPTALIFGSQKINVRKLARRIFFRNAADSPDG